MLAVAATVGSRRGHDSGYSMSHSDEDTRKCCTIVFALIGLGLLGGGIYFLGSATVDSRAPVVAEYNTAVQVFFSLLLLRFQRRKLELGQRIRRPAEKLKLHSPLLADSKWRNIEHIFIALGTFAQWRCFDDRTIFWGSGDLHPLQIFLPGSPQYSHCHK